MKIINRIVKCVLFLMILVMGIILATYMLMPGIPSFYKEKHYDAVFFGTSQSYCSFDPEVFDEYGLKTYNRGRQQQTMNYTYYIIEDALDACNIDVVVLEIFGMFYEADDNRFVSEGVRDSTLNDMRFSKIKADAIRDCVPKELQLGYYFPLDKYHSRWENLDYSSWKSFYNSALNPYYEEADRGYMRWTESEVCVDDYWSIAFSEIRRDVYDENVKYLDKIYELCQDKEVELVLVKTPLPCYDRVVEETNTVSDWAEEHDVALINYMRMQDILDLNFYTDSLDGGTHLNESGAGKVSRHLAMYLRENNFD